MKKERIYHRAYALPSFFLYTVFFIVPVIGGIYFSMTDWSAFRAEMRFVGLANYRDIFFSTGPYLHSIVNTLEFTLATVFIKLALGLVLALMLNEGLRTKNVLRTIFFLPFTLSPLIIGIVFVSILGPDGPVNAALRFVGLDHWTRGWLTDVHTAFPSAMGVEIWRMAGLNMVILLAGLQGIPGTYYEAAAIDGAGAWQRFVRITVPLLMPALSIAFILNTIHGLRVFDIIFALTNGGPGSLTEVINTQVYREFSAGHYGMSNALATLAFLFTVLVAFVLRRLSGEREAAA